MKYKYVPQVLITLVLVLTSVGIALVGPSTAGESETEEVAECNWPQFLGQRRDNVSDDTGLMKRWPDGGPRLIWKTAKIGYGFSSVAIVDGMIYTAGNMEDITVITALDMSGKVLWQTRSGPAFTKSYPGSRGTPTISDNKLYHLNGNGYIVCLKARTGEEIWTLNISEKFSGQMAIWGWSESMLVDGENVICSPGGEEVSMAALNKHTGETIWTCAGFGDKSAYTSPILVDYMGLRQIITTTSASAIGVAADTGTLLWKYHYPAELGGNVSTPIYHNGHIVLFRFFGMGATMLRLNVSGQTCAVEEAWHTGELDCGLAGVVLVDGYLYGQADGNQKRRHWACLKLKTGRTMYSVDGLPVKDVGTLTYADDMLYLLGDPGNVALVPASPEGFNIVSQFQLPKDGKGPALAQPVVCGGRLYLRHGDYLYAYSVRLEAEAR